MRRLALICCIVGAGPVVFAAASSAEDASVYKVELDNAFGLVVDSDVKVAGVRAGKITDLDINEHKRAVATIELEPGLDSFRTDVRCESKPQSLIAEFFIDCQPGKSERELPRGATVPVEQTAATVQPDLVNNILREPYRDRLRLIINEFGTGLAGRPEDLNRAIRSGAPALRETDKVLRVLAAQNKVIRDLNVDSDEIFTALADNRKDVARFVTEARQTAQASADRSDDISGSFRRLPTFLEELRPTMARLGELATEQTPLLTNLRSAAPELERFTRTVGPFSDASLPALDTLGDAAKIGRRAFAEGKEEIGELGRFGRNVAPVSDELAKFLFDLDDRNRAVVPDPQSPNGRGVTAFEGLLNYGYYQTGALNTFDQFGHALRLSLIAETPCTLYSQLEYAKHSDGSRDACVAWSGPNQPGLTQDVCVTKSGRGHTIQNFCPYPAYGPEVGASGAPTSTSGQTREVVPEGSGPAPALPPRRDPVKRRRPPAGKAPSKVVPDLPEPLDDVLDRVKPETNKIPALPGRRAPVRLRARGSSRRSMINLLDYLLGDDR